MANSLLEKSLSRVSRGYKEIENSHTSKYPTDGHSMSNIQLTIEQFSNLTIEKKLKYSSKNPKNTYWTEKEEQQMRELSRQLAYAFPFEVIKGKVDIFSIDPALAVQVQVKREKLKAKSRSVQENNFSLYKLDELVTIYDIFGRVVKQFNPENIGTKFKIQVADLQSGIYIIKVRSEVAKFVKE